MRKIKLTFILLVAVIVTAVMPANVLAITGSGTINSPYVITSVSDLALVKNNLSAHYRLGADIKLTSAWTPIGTSEQPFTGSFNGDGYTISGLTVSQSGSSVFVGLFGYSTGDIKDVNVKMTSAGITATATGYIYAGGIVGYNNGGAIEGCSAEGLIDAEITTSSNAANAFVGMIAGRSTGPVSSSESTGTITASITETSATGTVANDAQVYAGGIVGLSENDLAGNSSEVSVEATSSATSDYVTPKAYAGGIAGSSTGNVTESKASGNVTATVTGSALEASAYAGGLIGKNNGDIEIAQATGDVSARTTASSAKTYAGGLVGYSSGDVFETYATGTTTATATTLDDAVYAGGLIGLSNGQISTSYAVGTATADTTSSGALQGGLAGFASTAAVNSYYKDNSSYTTFTGCGTAKTEEELKLQSTFDGWNFETVWKILEEENSGYPYLIDLSNVAALFEDVEYTYDGTEKTLVATNIADNVTVTYTNNTATNAGVYNAVATLTAEGYSPTQLTAKLTIKPIVLTIKGLVVNDKEYDNTTTATIDASNAVIEGVLEGDDVAIDAENSVANFVTENVGDARQVIISEIKLVGEDAGNYTTGIYYSEADIHAGTYDHVVFNGSGTKEDPYIISDEDELNAVRGKLDAHFKLANNIVLSETWVPIGRLNAPFEGSFDGNNFTISGISVDKSINYTYSGLFGYSTGTISNLNVLINDNIFTTASNVHIGAIAGYNGGTITNCIVNGSISTSPISTYVYVGGIAGYNAGTISYCDSNVEIIAYGSTVYAGGAVGENANKIEKTTSTGAVTVEDALFAYAGGFVGINNFYIENCYSLGDATVNISDTAFMVDVGGFVGRIESGNVKDSYSTGTPSTSLAATAYLLTSGIGGFASYNTGLVTGCYYDSVTSGMSDSGNATPKTTAELKTASIIEAWDAEIWGIDESNNNGYPYIRKNFQLKESVLLGYDNRTVTVSAYTDIVSATLIVASYSEGALVDIDFNESYSIDKGETKTYTVSSDFKEIVGGSVKVMLWKNFSSAIPLCTYKEVQVR